MKISVKMEKKARSRTPFLKSLQILFLFLIGVTIFSMVYFSTLKVMNYDISQHKPLVGEVSFNHHEDIHDLGRFRKSLGQISGLRELKDGTSADWVIRYKAIMANIDPQILEEISKIELKDEQNSNRSADWWEGQQLLWSKIENEIIPAMKPDDKGPNKVKKKPKRPRKIKNIEGKAKRLELAKNHKSSKNEVFRGETLTNEDGETEKEKPKTKSTTSRPTTRKPINTTGCPLMSIRRVKSKIDKETSCIARTPTTRDCAQAKEMHHITNRTTRCPLNTYRNTIICKLSPTYRRSIKDEVVVTCNKKACGKSAIYLGCMDHKLGVMKDENEWKRFKTITRLQKKLPTIIRANSGLGYEFCILKCKRKRTSRIKAQQLLVFPPVLKGKVSKTQNAININIVTQDSVSRAHFYRMMRKTVKAMRGINKNQTMPARVFDFELLQSYASFTLANLQRLMAGKNYPAIKNKTIRSSGIEVLFDMYKTLGYHTVVQEDLCWYDEWDKVLFSNKDFPDRFNFEQIWQKYRKAIKDQHVNSIGLNPFSCTVYESYNITHPYDNKKTPRVCWAGRSYSTYIMSFVRSVLSASDQSNIPVLLYTHLNTAHEKSGLRIKSDDVTMSSFLKRVALDQNTLTIFLSDHGSKTTSYSTSTMEGRFEVFSPFMFVVVPDRVAAMIGEEAMKALEINEKRLVTLSDLHDSLVSLARTQTHKNLAEETPPLSGLFAPISPKRTCSDLNLDSEVLCRCEGADKFLDNDNIVLHWLAEFALGKINNMIQYQFLKSQDTFNNINNPVAIGNGYCQRFTGMGIEMARQWVKDEIYVTSFIIVVRTATNVTNVEDKFQVDVEHNVAPEMQGILFKKYVRVSRYEPYRRCADPGVDIKLCACSRRFRPKRRRVYRILREPGFDVIPKMYLMNTKCLRLIVRKKQKSALLKNDQMRVVTYEVANTCMSRIYYFKMEGSYLKSKVSRQLPVALRLHPRTVHFVATVLKEWRYGKFKPVLYYKLSPQMPWVKILKLTKVKFVPTPSISEQVPLYEGTTTTEKNYESRTEYHLA